MSSLTTTTWWAVAIPKPDGYVELDWDGKLYEERHWAMRELVEAMEAGYDDAFIVKVHRFAHQIS